MELRARVAALERGARRLRESRGCNSSHIKLYSVDEHDVWSFIWALNGTPCTCQQEPLKAYMQDDWLAQ